MAVASSSIGGTVTALVRFLVRSTDATTIAALRFGSGALLLLGLALVLRRPWPRGRDWLAVAALGILFFGLSQSLFNVALGFTTAARGALAMATLPLLTMVAGSILRVEVLTLRKSLGVLIAIGGVAFALVTGLASSPPEAWRGDLIMVGAAACMALYNVWSRPFIGRCGPLAFVAVSMAAGSVFVASISQAGGSFAALGSYGAPQWIAVAYIGVIGSALSFYLWVSALERTTPTRVASTLTLNPVTASALAAVLLGEPMGIALLVGIVAVLAGIWIAAT